MKKELIEALNSLKNLEPSAVNPHFGSKYVPLAKILEEARNELSRHGLAIMQSTKTEVINDKTFVFVKTSIICEEGELLSTGWTGLPVSDNPQKAGAVITYLRRYTLSSLLGIATEEDDDANSAVADPASEKQLKYLKKLDPDEELSILNFNKKHSELTRSEASELITIIKSGAAGTD